MHLFRIVRAGIAEHDLILSNPNWTEDQTFAATDAVLGIMAALDRRNEYLLALALREGCVDAMP